MTTREKAESLVEIAHIEGDRYVVRWSEKYSHVSPPDDLEGTAARHHATVNILEEIIAREAGVTVQGKRYRIDPGKEPWDQPTVRLLDAAFVAGMTLLLGLICGVLFGVYLPGAVWRAMWPF